jgi:hypothetical protein
VTIAEFDDNYSTYFPQVVTVDPAQQYLFSVWVRTNFLLVEDGTTNVSNLGDAFLALSCDGGMDEPAAIQHFTPGSSWTRVSVASGTLPSDCTSLAVAVGGAASGAVSTGVLQGEGYPGWYAFYGPQLEQTSSTTPGTYVATGDSTPITPATFTTTTLASGQHYIDAAYQGSAAWA